MAEVLVLVDEAGGEPKKIALELLTAARTLGAPSAVVVGAEGTADACKETLANYGAAKIYAAESVDAAQYLVTPQVDVLAELVKRISPAAVLVAASAEGKEIAARLAIRVDAGLLVDAVAINADGTVEQSIFGGAYSVRSNSTKNIAVISVRPGSISAEPAEANGTLESVALPAIDPTKSVKITERRPVTAAGRPELAEATVVVAGGRGVGSAEQFAMVEKLADAFGGAVGASRAAVDAGYCPAQFQIGQTGKTVAPQLYFALGISGAIQHRAGMQTSKTVIAINKDAEAPIFEVADFGVVGDLFSVVPQLIDEVNKRKAN